jgi:hypothetical protein
LGGPKDAPVPFFIYARGIGSYRSEVPSRSHIKVNEMKRPDVVNILEEMSLLDRRLSPKDEGDPSFRKRYPYSGFEF